ncbi:uncharacterized protein LOC100377768 [Saccoglossus kowalevskii]|uniref:Uncharacterized protein LOC100377768 n=1 Tax=Saccoglossus kowalevskii TaxID=10224 RepID=A0ABM0M3X6_SACKO|nr:PREDICTED: uncharacterized protein LOC100377768 [Saccoglossus kowalevskii]
MAVARPVTTLALPAHFEETKTKIARKQVHSSPRPVTNLERLTIPDHGIYHVRRSPLPSPCSPRSPTITLPNIHLKTSDIGWMARTGGKMTFKRNIHTGLFDVKPRSGRKKPGILRTRHSERSFAGSQATDAEEEEMTPYVRFRRAARVIRLLCTACLAYMKSASASAIQGSWLEVVEQTLQAAENEAKKSGTDTKHTKATIVSAAHPDLTFDPTDYLRFTKREDSIPGKIKEYLRLPVSERTPEIVQNIVRTMLHFEEFAKYPPDIQTHLCEHAWWDRFGRNRVICREGQKPEGLYIVLTGKLTENTKIGQTFILNKGDKFGETDMISGSVRRSTVMTKGDVELFCVHGQDYEEIFDTKVAMTSDACLDYLRSGQVIVQDSRSNEWIYIIKSGKCDVLKKLVSNVCCIDQSRVLYHNYKKAQGASQIQQKHDENTIIFNGGNNSFIAMSKKKTGTHHMTVPSESSSRVSSDVHGERRKKQRQSDSAIKVPRRMSQTYGTNGCLRRGSDAQLPHCVKLSELTAGDCFGLYTVIPGVIDAGVSLVSRGAEAIRINKAFFLKFADKPLFTQIEMRYEPYPCQDRVLEELDVTSQWEEYKQMEFKNTLEKLKKK